MVSNPPITPASPTAFFRVGNDEIFGSERALHSIERLQFLALVCVANNQPPALEQVHVKDVRRLAHLPQNIVRRIDGVADGPLIKQLQPLRNLFRRRFDRSSSE